MNTTSACASAVSRLGLCIGAHIGGDALHHAIDDTAGACQLGNRRPIELRPKELAFEGDAACWLESAEVTAMGAVGQPREENARHGVGCASASAADLS